MPLNDSFLQELKYKTDIEDIISTYVTLKRRGYFGWLMSVS